MVNDVTAAPPRGPDLDEVFAALADPTRRGIVERLARGEATVGELAEPYAISAPAISRHLRVLERAGLLERRVEGRVHHCRLRTQPLATAQDWMAVYRGFWEGQFDRLAAFLDAQTDTRPDTRPYSMSSINRDAASKEPR